jgi:predicted ABC-type ATPase
MFKKYFGDFEKLDDEHIPLQFEKAKVLLKKQQTDEANKIIRNIALSLYYDDEHKKFVEKADAYFAGVDFDHFMAADYAAIKNNPKVTPEDIIESLKYSELPVVRQMPFDDVKRKVTEVENKVDALISTTEKYRIKGEKNTAQYTPEREKLHIEIIEKLIEDNLEKYIPKEGEKPTFILLGGRGGSGKSNFKGLVYDDHFVVLDADKIKEMLPEYKGWNAAEVHEESSDILEQAMLICQRNGLNVVVDATMDTGLSAVRRLQLYKEKGYKTEAHYMFLPPQKSAQRAVARFLKKGETGRYVPIDALLAMKNNERNFDIIKDNVDSWSFYTAEVHYGESPILLASSKQEESYMGLKRSKHFFDLSEKGMQTYSAQSEEFKNLDAKIKMKIKAIKSGEKE